MKKTTALITILFSTAILLMACSGDAGQTTNNEKIKGNQATENQEELEESIDISEEKDESENMSKPEESKPASNSSNDISSTENNDSNVEHNASSNPSKSEDNDVLSQYSAEEIEYARVWLQLGANQEIDELYVEHLSKGTPLNPDDVTSIDYPEDVIQLSGTRLVDGVITYSGNGDGTINVYNVPKRWDGKNPAGEDVYKKVIEDIEQEYIDIGDDEKVEKLIEILNIN